MSATPQGTASTTAGARAVRVTALGYSPPTSDRLLLDGIDLEVPAGEVTAVVGPNGAGKTTLLRLLAGLASPTAGSVELVSGDGARDGRPGDARRRARLLHMVAAEHRPVFDFTVEQTVAMGRYPHRGRSGHLSAADRRLVLESLEQTDVAALAQRSVLQLSSGELRRVWIARALVSEARFLLLDEPTANLDLAHALAVLDLARDLARRGRGVVLALHDLHGAFEVAHRVALLDGGRLVASGPPEAVLTPDNVAAVFAVRFEAVATGTGEMARTRVLPCHNPPP